MSEGTPEIDGYIRHTPERKTTRTVITVHG